MSKKTEIAEMGKLLGGLQIIRSIATSLSMECDCRTQYNEDRLGEISRIANSLISTMMEEFDKL